MKHSLFTVNINDINYVLKFWLKATWDHKWNFVLTLWILNFNKSYLLHIKEPNQSLCVIVIILANTHIVWWLILRVSVTGHGVPRWNITSSCVCEGVWGVIRI